MTKKIARVALAAVFILPFLVSCHSQQGDEETSVSPVAPVTVTSPRIGKMADYSELMATSAFLVKAVIKSPVTGYVEKCTVSPGEKVAKNQVLFQLRTRESEALRQDTLGSIPVGGRVMMRASIDGVIASIGHPQGDFVQEGDDLGTLVMPGSLVFLMEVPYEMRSMISGGREFKLLLPDNREIGATVKSVLPSMSGASQTQRVVLQPHSLTDIPENLLARVRIVRSMKSNAVILPKTAILNDEVMKNFWVMKMISDTMAVKISVEPGITGPDSVEVVSPVFSTADRILTSGNYGLGDTARVRIIRGGK